MAPGRAGTRPGMDVYWYERDTTMGIIVLLGMTIVLQLMAAVLALRLIWITAQRTGWVVLALALILLALQRGLLFQQVAVGEVPLPPLISAVLGLGIAVCLVVGMAWIAPLFVLLRHAGEAEIQKQRAEYEMIFHAVPVELRFKDTNNRLIRVNNTAAVADGYTMAEIEGKSCWDLYPEELAAKYYADDLEVMRTGMPKRHFVMPHQTPSGTLRWVEVDKLPCRDRNGTISGVLVVATDITERKRAEEALARRMAQMEVVHSIAEEITRELNLSTLLDLIVQRVADLLGATRGVIYLWDEDTQTLRPRAGYNISAWLSDVSLRLGEGVAGTVARRRQRLLINDYQHPSYVHPAFVKHDRPAAIIAEPLVYRDRLVGVLVVMHSEPGQDFTPQDCEPLAVLATQATIAIENARLFEDSARRQAWLATILDINKRIAAHEDMASLLAQIAEEAKRLIGADGAILRLLLGDRLVAVGATPYGPTAADAPETRLGEGIVGRAALENRVFVVPDVQADPIISPFRKQRAAEAGINAMLCVPVRGPHHVLGVLSSTSTQRRVFTDDEAMVLSAYAEQVAIAIEHARLLAAEEERTAVLERTNLILRDEITERQRVEAERERLIAEQEAKNAEMERFTYTVSHDLKSPLITICGFLGLLEQDARKGNVERMQTDITYIHTAAATMQRLLDELLELSRIGRVVHPPTEIPLSALAHEAVTLVGGQIAARGVQVHIAPDLPVVLGDRQRLLEVLQNLVDNAVKFMGTQHTPRIEIGCRQAKKETVYYVRDNGVGIAPQYHEKVFGLFERLEPEGDCTGVGLALVKRIIEVHGGRIWVESAGQGCGSTFCFTLSQP
jgi:PAS domain S-box-containing protein